MDPPSTYQRIIERGPWASYERCRECGVDAGRACRDMDDREALEVCDGRRLVINDSASRCRVTQSEWVSRRDRPPDSSKRAKAKQAAGKIGEPVYAPCECCGVSVRLWGQALTSGRTWCAAPVCRRHKAGVYRAQRREQRTQPRPTRSCYWCHAVLPAVGRSKAAYPCCGDLICRSRAKYAARKAALERAQK